MKCISDHLFLIIFAGETPTDHKYGRGYHSCTLPRSAHLGSALLESSAAACAASVSSISVPPVWNFSSYGTEIITLLENFYPNMVSKEGVLTF